MHYAYTYLCFFFANSLFTTERKVEKKKLFTQQQKNKNVCISSYYVNVKQIQKTEREKKELLYVFHLLFTIVQAAASSA